MQATAITGCSLAVCAIGLLSNIVQAIMMISKSEKVTSHGIYLLWLALADSSSLVLKLSEGAFFLAVLRIDTSLARSGWKTRTAAVVTTLDNISQCLSGWLLVAIAVDRVIALCLPTQRLLLCSSRRALWVSLYLLVASSVSFLPVMAVYLHHIDNLNDTVPLPHSAVSVIVTSRLPFGACDALPIWTPYMVFLPALMSYLLPAVCVVLLTIVLVCTLRVRYSKLHMISLTDRLTAERIKKQNRLTIILLVVIAKSIILGVPYSLGLVVFFTSPSSTGVLMRYSSMVPSTDLVAAPGWLVLTSLEVIMLVARASHVWCLLGDDYFQRLLYQLLCSERANMDAPLSAATTKRREVHNKLDSTPSGQSTRIIGIRVSSNLSSLHHGHDFLSNKPSNEIATPDTIRTNEDALMTPNQIQELTSHIRPTDVVLKETAKRLSIIVENSKL